MSSRYFQVSVKIGKCLNLPEGRRVSFETLPDGLGMDLSVARAR